MYQTKNINAPNGWFNEADPFGRYQQQCIVISNQSEAMRLTVFEGAF